MIYISPKETGEELITKDFKFFGPGGAIQAVTYSEMKSIIDISKLR